MDIPTAATWTRAFLTDEQRSKEKTGETGNELATSCCGGALYHHRLWHDAVQNRRAVNLRAFAQASGFPDSYLFMDTFPGAAVAASLPGNQEF